MFSVTVVMVSVVAVPLLPSLIVTAPLTTPETAAPAATAAVCVTDTEVVSAVPVTVTAPPVMVLFTAPAKFWVIETVVPPLTPIVGEMLVVCVANSETVTFTVPLTGVVTPT